MAKLMTVPLDDAAAEGYGRLRTALQSAGRLIGPMDMLIAAHALSLNLPPLTGNTRLFARVPGLRVLSLSNA